MMERIPILRRLCFVFTVCATGCATVLNGDRQKLTVNSNPPGAYFEVDGLSGTTPGSVPVERKQHQHTVTVWKPGYQTSQTRVGQSTAACRALRVRGVAFRIIEKNRRRLVHDRRTPRRTAFGHVRDDHALRAWILGFGPAVSMQQARLITVAPALASIRA